MKCWVTHQLRFSPDGVACLQIQAGVFCLDLPKEFSLDRIMNRVACEPEEKIHSVSRHGVQIYEARQLALILVMTYLASS